jgi:hypothetical protein
LGVLFLAACVSELFAGFLLLARKHVAIALGILGVVLSLGFVMMWFVLTTAGVTWSNSLIGGLLLSSPLFASAIPLVGVGVNYRKMTKEASDLPDTFERLIGGSGIAGGALTIMGVVCYFAPYPFRKPFIDLLVIGAPLLVASFLARRRYKR